jgi:hypothetical protein
VPGRAATNITCDSSIFKSFEQPGAELDTLSLRVDTTLNMVLTYFTNGVVFASLALVAVARHAPLHLAHHQHRHEARDVEERQLIPPGMRTIRKHPPKKPATATTSASVLTYVTPSPGASPVPVTKQSQLVGSYIAQYTLCELPPIGWVPVSRNGTDVTANPTATPYTSYSVTIPPGNGTCTTIYKPTMTQVCATTLTALAEQYTVTNCHQDLTFSSEYGFVLVTPTPTPTATSSPLELPSPPEESSKAVSATGPWNSSSSEQINGTAPIGTGTAPALIPRQASSSSSSTITPGPTVETLTTYYLAPWQELTAGTAPTDVDLKVCRTFKENGSTECIREYQVWSTMLVTETATSVKSLNISTTIHGRSQLIIENFVANITEMLTTLSMSTTINEVYQTEWTMTHTTVRAGSTRTVPTVFKTLTVEQVTPTSS